MPRVNIGFSGGDWLQSDSYADATVYMVYNDVLVGAGEPVVLAAWEGDVNLKFSGTNLVPARAAHSGPNPSSGGSVPLGRSFLTDSVVATRGDGRPISVGPSAPFNTSGFPFNPSSGVGLVLGRLD